MAEARDDNRPVVSIVTLGCKLNQSDSEAMARRLAGEGVRISDRPVREAEAFVINTCSVTHVADRKARHMVRLARRLSPDARIVLTGCYAETAPPDIAGSTGADLVLRNAEKPQVAERLLAHLASRGDPAGGCPAPARDGLRPDGRPSGRTRAFVKIQEGCNELCAFCIVPYTRGREVSVPIERVVDEVQAREAEGVVEVVLTGTQLGNYGRDLGWTEHGPRRLLEALLERTSVPRIRLSSLQAQDIHPALLDLWQDRRLCPHFHLPLQSGSDRVLAAMRRRYTAGQFLEAVEAVRARVPGVAITTDVIAGFPGETASDFEATLEVSRKARFAAMHCFPYSKREQTGAAKMAGHLAPEARRERLERLLDLARESSTQFRQAQAGSITDVLWEQVSGGLWQGLTGNYVRVYTAASEDLTNRLLPVRLERLEAEGMRGVIALTETPAYE